MFTFIARSAWTEEEGLRLDAATYASGGLEERDHITLSRRLPAWRRLDALAHLFVESRFARVYVQDAQHGTPYITSSDMLLADLKGLLYLSNKRTPQMERLRIHEGWTLISCSGTIGRTVFVRGEMDGLAASHDVIRCVPGSNEVRPGYLYTFLSTAQAQAMIRQKTYGNVIQHIEPEHIADMPVPIPNDAFQERIHGLVTRAAEARTEASRLLDAASGYFDALAGPMPSSHDHAYAAGIMRSRDLDYRLDAFHHVGWASEGMVDDGQLLADLAEVITPNNIPRIYTKNGVPFLSGIDIYQARPNVRVRIATRIAAAADVRVQAGDIVLQKSGQRYGLLGRPAYVTQAYAGWAASNDLVRVRAQDLATQARLFAFLLSNTGHRRTLRHSYGTSIPHLTSQGILNLRIPMLPEELLAGAMKALQLRNMANEAEDIAIREVEAWVG